MTGPILIVDDDPVQRRLLQAAVTKSGYEAVLAEGGEEGLRLLDGNDFSVVILDLVMPDLGGIEVLKRMRERGLFIPVIVQTSQGGIETVVTAMRNGAFDFVVKPASPERLQTAIANALKVEALEGEVSERLAAARRLAGPDRWREVMEAYRPITARLWAAADLNRRARLVRHLRPWWDVHRHRIAARIGRALEALKAENRLTVVAGRLGRVAQNHVPTLAAQGFSRAQIDAIALLGA